MGRMTSHILWKIKHVPNQQPVTVFRQLSLTCCSFQQFSMKLSLNHLLIQVWDRCIPFEKDMEIIVCFRCEIEAWKRSNAYWISRTDLQWVKSSVKYINIYINMIYIYIWYVPLHSIAPRCPLSRLCQFPWGPELKTPSPGHATGTSGPSRFVGSPKFEPKFVPSPNISMGFDRDHHPNYWGK